MSQYPSDYRDHEFLPQPQTRLPLPVYQPIVTYILLAAIALMYAVLEFAGGSTNTLVLIKYGANFGPAILYGDQYWRFFTSMFLHIGLAHLAFNGYALFIFGLEMERLYGPVRFAIIYILSGLFGSLVSFAVRGEAVLSAGASGAIFGIIGMNLAFFLLQRDSLGQFGRQRITSTLVIIGINLVFGFTVPGIDNFAHIGGLVTGFVLGYGLAPHYQVDNVSLPPRVINTTSLLKQSWIPALGVGLLVLGTSLSVSFWLAQLG